MKDALIHMIENKESADTFEMSYDDKLNYTDFDKINNKIKNILK